MEKIFVTRSSMPPKEEYYKEIASIWENHLLTNMGEKHQRLEKELKKYLGVDQISLFVNGHMALELGIQALGMSGEVITTPFTFISTIDAIIRNGLTPVFCDINENDYTIDVNKLEELITDKTSAIVPVHVYGNICNVEKIAEIAEKHHLKLFYDAAHAFGETLKGRGIGTFGDASMFSFHATKVFNTIEGGAVCFSEPQLLRKLYQLKNFGIKDEVTIEDIGANAKMNEFQAAMGLCNLLHVDEEIEKRRWVFEKYHKCLQGIPGLVIPQELPGLKRNYAYYPVVFDQNILGISRDDVYEELLRQNIVARKYFYPPANEVKCIVDLFGEQKTPVTAKISRQVLTLPIYSELPLEQVDRICDIILKRIKKG